MLFGAGQSVEVSGFDFVDELDGIAFGGDQVIPAARDHEAFGKSEDAVGDGIAVMMVVEKPGVDVALTQSVLDGGEVHGKGLFYMRSELRAASFELRA